MDTLIKIVELITKLLAIPAAVIAVLTGAFGVYTYFRDSRRKTCVDTMEAYKKLQDEVFAKLNTWQQEQVESAVETADNVGYYELEEGLAKIEHFCVGINRGVYDFETFYQMSHGYFDYKLMRIFVSLLEQKIGDADEDYYNNLHRVWNRMAERSKKEL